MHGEGRCNFVYICEDACVYSCKGIDTCEHAFQHSFRERAVYLQN